MDSRHTYSPNLVSRSCSARARRSSGEGGHNRYRPLCQFLGRQLLQLDRKWRLVWRTPLLTKGFTATRFRLGPGFGAAPQLGAKALSKTRIDPHDAAFRLAAMPATS